MRCSSAYHCCHFIWVTVTFLSALTSLALLLWPLSLTMHFCPHNCCSLDVFSFSHHSLQTNKTVVHENPRRSGVSEILKPPCLAPTIIPRSKSHVSHSHFCPILTFGLKNSWRSWPCLHAFLNLVAATWLADLIFALTSWCTGIPNKVLCEIMIQ